MSVPHRTWLKLKLRWVPGHQPSPPPGRLEKVRFACAHHIFVYSVSILSSTSQATFSFKCTKPRAEIESSVPAWPFTYSQDTETPPIPSQISLSKNFSDCYLDILQITRFTLSLLDTDLTFSLSSTDNLAENYEHQLNKYFSGLGGLGLEN